MKTESVLELVKKLTAKQKLTAAAMVGLLSIGTLGAMGELSGKEDTLVSRVGKAVGIIKPPPPAPIPPQSGTPQLSKEYIYAGSRMLATEDYGVAPANPQAKGEPMQEQNNSFARQNLETTPQTAQNDNFKSIEGSGTTSK